MSTTSILPRAHATVTGLQAVFVTADGTEEALTAAPGEDIRQVVIARAIEEARTTGTGVELTTAGDRGTHHLLVTDTGTLTPIHPTTGHESERSRASAPPPLSDEHSASDVEDAAPVSRVRTRSRDAAPIGEETPNATEADTDTDVDTSTDVSLDDGRDAGRVSFIRPDEPATVRGSGWRGVLARAGIRIPPSRAQVERARREVLAARQWAGCRSIAVANGKGGVGKTMTTAMLAACYARHGGGNVLAWDNNDTRGTLGWRTEPGLYDTTIRDLLPATDTLLGAGASVSDVSRFVHHQPRDRYDVLRSNPELLATDQRLTAAEFDRLVQVATRYYRMVVFDSGNDESADRWQRMIDSSHQLVIPTIPAPEAAESAALLLEALRNRDEHSAHLADTAVVVVTQSEPGTAAQVARIAAGFAPLVGTVATIPYDPALKAGALRFDTLRTRTRDAWLGVAAAIAETLTALEEPS